jgi:GNAT superfamily N-acetyltransferase
MQTELFRHADIDIFLELADGEGWVCDRWEFEFLFRTFPQGCLVARDGERPVGFITSIKYRESGWVGNLLVRKELRGNGVGTMLMEKALSALSAAGAGTVWLTASPSGKPIYEALGFVAVDVVNRWVGTGIGGHPTVPETMNHSEMLAIDQAGWGDWRDTLIDAVAVRGRVLSVAGAFLVCQPCGGGLQLGPWSGTGHAAQVLLGYALAETEAGERIFLDVPIRNTVQTDLLLKMGFSIRGSTLLMCRGEAPAYAPERVFALASMGSMG